MIVADANLTLYLYVEGPHTDEAQEVLRHDPQWVVPPLWQSEFLNVMWLYVRQGVFSEDRDVVEVVAGDAWHEVEAGRYAGRRGGQVGDGAVRKEELGGRLLEAGRRHHGVELRERAAIAAVDVAAEGRARGRRLTDLEDVHRYGRGGLGQEQQGQQAGDPK